MFPVSLRHRVKQGARKSAKTGQIAPPPETARAGFARDEQFAELEGFMMRVMVAAPEKSV